MTIEQINPMAIKAKAQSIGGNKMKAVSSEGFSSMLDMVGAGMAPMAATSAAMYGGNTAAAALNAAFSGMSQTAGAMNSGGASYGASFGGGVSSGAPYLSAGMSYGASTTSGYGSSPAVAGTDNLSQADMINTMNQNNLQLLELQAMMQNNMQGWNTKSNILSADHRARMSMIEKFTARG